LAAGRANRDFDRQATLGGLFSALTGTNGSTNFKRQRDDNQGKRRQCCPIKNAVYYPEELSLLGQILDQAVQSLPLSMRTPQNRAAIAKNILACAATGERDPIELRLAASNNLKVTVAA
jgi:hypothetical protein